MEQSKRFLSFSIFSLFLFLLIPQYSQAQVVPGRYYFLVAQHSNKILAIENVSANNGAKTVQWTQSLKDNHIFRFEPAGNGYYYIIAKHSGKGLAIEGPSTANGAKCVQWDVIRNKPNHMFRLESAGNNGYYIIAKHSNKTIAIEGPSTANGAKCIQWDKISGKANHIFKLIVATNGTTTTLPNGDEVGVPRYARATKHKNLDCPSGSFYDPIKGGSCWSCPSGYKRSVYPVDQSNACIREAKTVHKKATDKGKAWGLLGTNCDRGEFYDPNGRCYTCPAGYTRTVHPVTGGKACEKREGGGSSPATKQSSLKCGRGYFYDPSGGRLGSCWSCPTGFSRTTHPVSSSKACEME